MTSLNELIWLILDWSRARKIIPNATPESQLLKAVSEMGELADAHNKGQKDAARDAVGDIVVCLVNYCELSGTSLAECVDGAWNEIKDRRGTLLPNGCFVKEQK